MAKYMTVTNHHNGKIDLRHLGKNAFEAVPIEFHYKEDGTIDDLSSIAIVMNVIELEVNVFGEMSLNTLKECLNEVGYDIVKK